MKRQAVIQSGRVATGLWLLDLLYLIDFQHLSDWPKQIKLGDALRRYYYNCKCMSHNSGDLLCIMKWWCFGKNHKNKIYKLHFTDQIYFKISERARLSTLRHSFEIASDALD